MAGPLPARLGATLTAPDALTEMDADASGTVMAAVDNSRKLPLPSLPFVYPYRGGAFYYERECYKEYYEIIEGLLQSGKTCITVTGTPGIGTSVFYAYFAEEYLKRHSDVWIIAAADVPGETTLVALIGEQDTPVYREKHETPVAFVRAAELRADAAGKALLWLHDGVPGNVRGDGPLVVFTSPDAKWLHAVEYYHCTHCMPLWTCQELHEATRVLGFGFSEDEIERRFRIFGGVARYCLHPDETAAINATEAIKREVSWVFDSQRLKQLLVGAETSRLLHYEPTEGSTTQYKTRLASQFVEKKLAEQVMSWNVVESEKIRWWVEWQDNAASLRGRIIEAERRLYITN